MTERTTFALDRDTVRRLKRLASRWKISQAAVVRRVIAEAESRPDAVSTDPVEDLEALHAAGRGLVREEADRYLAEVREDRAAWRGP